MIKIKKITNYNETINAEQSKYFFKMAKKENVVLVKKKFK